MTHSPAALHHDPTTKPGAQTGLRAGHLPSPAGNDEPCTRPQRDLSEHALHGRSLAGVEVVDTYAAHFTAGHAAIGPAAGHEAGHTAHAHGGMEHGAHGAEGERAEHAAHVDHTGHEAMFRQRIWVSLLLSIPVLLYNPTLQDLLHFSFAAFPGSNWVEPLLAIVVFVYGGVPFLQVALPELRNRRPAMMTLISLAISVVFLYSVAALMLPGQMGFFWELVALIDIMLLGHWIEMRTVRQASGALSWTS
jgi:P-type Cu2+ transporter